MLHKLSLIFCLIQLPDSRLVSTYSHLLTCFHFSAVILPFTIFSQAWKMTFPLVPCRVSWGWVLKFNKTLPKAYRKQKGIIFQTHKIEFYLIDTHTLRPKSRHQSHGYILAWSWHLQWEMWPLTIILLPFLRRHLPPLEKNYALEHVSYKLWSRLQIL